jgi:hypothetical protein
LLKSSQNSEQQKVAYLDKEEEKHSLVPNSNNNNNDSSTTSFISFQTSTTPTPSDTSSTTSVGNHQDMHSMHCSTCGTKYPESVINSNYNFSTGYSDTILNRIVSKQDKQVSRTRSIDNKRKAETLEVCMTQMSHKSAAQLTLVAQSHKLGKALFNQCLANYKIIKKHIRFESKERNQLLYIGSFS